MTLKPYRMHPEQCAFLLKNLIDKGLSVECAEHALGAADIAYSFGRADTAFGRTANETPYDPTEILATLVKKTDGSTS